MSSLLQPCWLVPHMVRTSSEGEEVLQGVAGALGSGEVLTTEMATALMFQAVSA